jgi:cytochrome c peroxidase
MAVREAAKQGLVVATGGLAAGFTLVALLAAAPPGEPVVDIASLKPLFARPSAIPYRNDTAPSIAVVSLGKRLFGEPHLSGSGTISCATCHDPRLGFADGQKASRAGATGRALRRHTPALWNLAWAPALYWDGRAPSLEAQARLPLEHPDEMAGSLAVAARRLADDADYRRAFADAFPGSTVITGAQILEAIAAYERTLVSPPTAFDRWVAGDETALGEEARRGLRLFAGRAGCILCHTGFAFTDYAFHDIGLPGTDLGRGPIIALPSANHAFKTPGLRELAWTAPYMHDGSLDTLDDVIRHYERGGVKRATRSRDMPLPFTLSAEERASLVAFLETLSSDEPPKPSREAWIGRPENAIVVLAKNINTISQRNRAFAPASIRVRRGTALTILNDDTRAHNVRIADPRLTFSSGLQEPGEHVSIRLDHAGRFEAHCGIHPTMRLTIEVE